MPKATKKKKEKQADFSKAKLKLGKGKKQASNATDTSFKARSIALPGQQSISRAILNADGLGPSEPTTANGLTLEDLFIRFRHPNAGVRKESLGGVKDILSVGVGRDVGKVLRALGSLVSDDDASVRKALLGLLAWCLPQLPVASLSPHLPLLVLQTSSSLSHIFPEIRLDACKLVHLLLDHVPSHVVGNWPREPSNILEGLRLAVGLGGEKGVNSQIGRLTGGAKLVTLRAMMEFVKKGLNVQSYSQENDQEWLDGWTEKRSKGKGVERDIRDVPTFEDLNEEGWLVGSSIDPISDSENAWEVGRLAGQGRENEDGVASVLSQLYISLHPLLLSTFLENAPTAFSPSSSSSASAEDIPLALCTTTASLTELLARAILTRSSGVPEIAAETKEVRSCISDFLKRMAAWFPFSSSRLNVPTPSGLTAGFELSLVYSNLAVLLAPRPVELVWPKDVRSTTSTGWRDRAKAIEVAWTQMRARQITNAKGKGKGKGKEKGADDWAMEEVASWVIEVLAPKKDVLSPSLTPAAYAAILPIVFSLITQPPSHTADEDDIPSTVGSAFLAYLSRTSSTSSLRSIGDKFVISLTEIHEQRFPRYPFFIPTSNVELRRRIREWFESVPKVIWELGNKNEESTRILLDFLLRLGLKGKGALDERYSLLSGQANSFSISIY
uniref:Pre-rRNA-processing protein n=1 Tax=Kwoniella dejecticola CBS 10117 TaxID=1296121 RepID=A0A1A6A3I7_9TREE|nr:pre-rRNA-processing protein IPI1 [Kwoniella dejecticola CBS 10117]OBR84618.1 pre-rRNA-processing protein IPI1 [Kwoniella dejecticola CBS 10117]